MLYIVACLIVGHLLALVPCILARIAGRRFGIAAAWIEISLVMAFGWWWFASLCTTPSQCGRQAYATMVAAVAFFVATHPVPAPDRADGRQEAP
jgi:hypothetical protein